MDEAIVQHIRRTYNLLVGERTAEFVKQEIGTACALESEDSMEVRGRDLVTGLPKTIQVAAKEIREALSEPVTAIVEAVRITLERTPPELSSDIMDKGIVLVGGGALLKGLDRLLANETGMPVHLNEEALSAVVMGTGTALEHFDLLSRVLISPRKLGS